ncbi:Chitotriosidase-1 [Dactylellina cionopaga]|nr:Chitotriosidase-1 [Dactylellina cionopaga]
MLPLVSLALVAAQLVGAMPANTVNAKRMVEEPISTVVSGTSTAFLYAFPTTIPPSILSELAGEPTSVGSIPAAGASESAVAGVPEQIPAVNDGAFTGYRSVGYYCDWYIYARDFPPQKLIIDQFTHLMVAFADIQPTGEVYHMDPAANFAKIFSETPNGDPSAAHGILEVLYRLKNENRNLKLSLSIGGWNYSQYGNFTRGTNTPEKRQLFATSVARLVSDMGLDGVDIDWEYPETEHESAWLLDIIRLCRQELDRLGSEFKVAKRFELSVAAPCGPHYFKWLNVPEMDKYLDFWNLMAYDFAGSWSKAAGHSSNFFPAGDASTDFSFDQALQLYLGAGVNPRKIVVGLPIYAHGFFETDGPGTPFNGVGAGQWTQTGFYDYNNLPSTPADVLYEDEKLYAAWTYNNETREMYSFDTPKTTKLKAEYVKSHGLGGMMYWQTNADKWNLEGNLIETAVRTLGGREAFEKRQNHINYPNSKFSNIKNYDGISVKPNHVVLKK